MISITHGTATVTVEPSYVGADYQGARVRYLPADVLNAFIRAAAALGDDAAPITDALRTVQLPERNHTR